MAIAVRRAVFNVFATVLAMGGRCLAHSLYRRDLSALRLDLAAARKALKGQRIPSPIAVSAAIAAEDRRFWRHNGIDPIAIARVMSRGLFLGRFEGGSTLHQQLVRVVTKRFERTLARKLRELILASAIESFLTKTEVATIYLHAAYFGYRMHGYSQACQVMAPAGICTLVQAASLAARLKYPEPRDPSQAWRQQVAKRTNYILRELKHIGPDLGKWSMPYDESYPVGLVATAQDDVSTTT